MRILTFLEHLAAADSSEQPAARRQALSQLTRTAATLLPAAVGAIAATTPALAQRAGTVLDALLMLLQVERLQEAFYGQVLAATGPLVPTAIRPDLTTIRTHQTQHIALLESFVTASGGVLPTRPNYDFTGRRGGAQAASFPDVLTNTDTMLVVAQLLEDLSVRAYTSQIVLLATNDDVMSPAASMLATEGRHAAHIRQLRRQRGATIKPWISGTDGGGPTPTATADFYSGEDRILQQVSAYVQRDTSSLLPITMQLTDAEKQAAATEAFGEPLPATATDGRVTLTQLIGRFTY